MRECNVCERRNCGILRAARKSGLGEEDMNKMLSQRCGLAVIPKPWKQPLILCAMVNSAQGVHDVLQSQGMYLQELKDKPFFKILVRE